MEIDKGGTVKIEDSIIFKRLNGSYLMSLGYFRTLIMLDQCHDFCETAGRNKWTSGKKFTKEQIIESIFVLYKTDMQYILDTFASEENKYVKLFNDLFNDMDESRLRNSFTSTDTIKRDILKGGINIENSIKITSANLYDYVPDFKCSTFSNYLVSILSEGKSITNGVILGVDATKNNAGYSSVFTNICDVVTNPNIPIAIFKSPATEYDAAGTSGVTNFIENMVKKADKNPTILGQLDPTKNTVYRVKVTARNVEFIDFKYTTEVPDLDGVGSGDVKRQRGGNVKSQRGGNDDNYITLHITKFFDQTEGIIPTPRGAVSISSKKVGSGTQNSVAYLTENFLPSDNIYLFKTIGDLGQALSYNIESQKKPDFTNFYITFDYLSALISSLFNTGTILEDTGNAISPLSIFTFSPQQLKKIEKEKSNLADIGGASELLELSRKRARSLNGFGKKKPKVKNISIKSLMTKLKSVGIKITRKRGKRRVYLSRPELIKKATAFRKLQLRAKKLKIRIMYKNRKGKYVYKTAKRLTSDIKKKMKKPVKKSNKKPVKKSNKKPVKKQMKQKFG